MMVTQSRAKLDTSNAKIGCELSCRFTDCCIFEAADAYVTCNVRDAAPAPSSLLPLCS